MKLNKPPAVAPDAPPPMRKPPPKRLLPNWLMAYREFTKENEAPEQYHLWCGLAAVAAVTGRKVKLTSRYFEVLTNLFLILVGPSRRVRKTTAIKIARSIVKRVEGVVFTSGTTSPEAAIRRMSKIQDKSNQAISAASYELGVFLGTGSKQDGMLDILIELYDGNPDFEKDTIARDLETIEAPWFQLIGATSPSWIGTHLSANAMEGGFGARCIWVFASDRILQSPFPEVNAEQERLRNALINDLQHINALEGEFQWGPGTKEFYERWYMDESRFPSQVDPRIVGYYNQKHIHVLKVAMLFSIAEHDTLTMEIRDLQAALDLLAATEPGMHHAFSHAGRNIYAQEAERIYVQVFEAGVGGVEYRKLLALNYHQLEREQLDNALRDLVVLGKIRQTGTIFIAAR